MIFTDSHVVLVQPPFFRLVGSHNDRGPLELAYLAEYLSRCGLRCTILNLDYTGALTHCSWRNLYERSHLLESAIRTDTGLLYESAEVIYGHEPTCVVLSAGDSITPWVDLGNAWIAAKLARLLKGSGARVIGTGPRLITVPRDVRDAFDAIISDMPLQRAAEVICNPRAAISPIPSPAQITPLIMADVTNSKYDVVMTSLGCVKQCTFCDAARLRYREIEPQIVADDIIRRQRDHVDIGDAIFLPRRPRLHTLKHALDTRTSRAPTFSCELSVDMTSATELQYLIEFGVVEVKLGVESADESAIKIMNKRHGPQDILRACERVRSLGLELTVYVLLGGPIPNPLAAAHKTLALCGRLPANDFVINVWAYNRANARPTDTHFSWDLVEEYGLQSVMPQFWQLQPQTKRSLGRIIDIDSPALFQSCP